MIDTGGAAACAGARAASGKDGLSLAPIPPSRRTFEFTLGSDNRSSSVRSRDPARGAVISMRGTNERKGACKSSRNVAPVAARAGSPRPGRFDRRWRTDAEKSSSRRNFSGFGHAPSTRDGQG